MPYSPDFVDRLERLLEKKEEMDLTRSILFPEKGNPKDSRTELLEKIVLELVKGKQGQGQGPDLQGLWNVVASMQTSNLDLYDRISEKLGSMATMTPAQIQVELKKMDLDFEKWKIEQQVAVEKWRSIASVFAPVLGPAAQYVTGKVSGQTQPAMNPPTTELGCSNCGHRWRVGSVQRGPIKCPECGTPVSSQLFEQPIITYTCEGCGGDLEVGAEILEDAQQKGITEIPLKCPSCQHVTNIVAKPLAEPPPEEAPPTREGLRPKYG